MSTVRVQKTLGLLWVKPGPGAGPRLPAGRAKSCFRMQGSHKCLVVQLCGTLCDPMDCSPPGSSVHVILQARMYWAGGYCHFFLQGIFSTQELNLGLQHCRQILYCLSHQERDPIGHVRLLRGLTQLGM